MHMNPKRMTTSKMKMNPKSNTNQKGGDENDLNNKNAPKNEDNITTPKRNMIKDGETPESCGPSLYCRIRSCFLTHLYTNHYLNTLQYSITPHMPSVFAKLNPAVTHRRPSLRITVILQASVIYNLHVPLNLLQQAYEGSPKQYQELIISSRSHLYKCLTLCSSVHLSAKLFSSLNSDSSEFGDEISTIGNDIAINLSLTGKMVVDHYFHQAVTIPVNMAALLAGNVRNSFSCLGWN